jgi:MraZ protein
MFRGRHSHTIDAKGRLSIPAAYREELRQAEGPPFLTVDLDCLKLYPYADWCERERRILAVADLDPDAKDFARHLISNACEAPIDRQGRILVPQYLREYAGLEKEVTLAGAGATVEVWDPARLGGLDDQTKVNFRQLSADLAKKLRS